MNPIYTVHEVNAYIKSLFEADPFFAHVYMRGEISNWSRAASGHCYFTLKDSNSEMRCVMWRTYAQAMPFYPKNGDEVVLTGAIALYSERGTYQFYAEDIQPLGTGILFQRFEALKQSLHLEGLFDEGRKISLPILPKRIGIVTSPTTAALQDILNVLRRRQPLVEVVLSATAVQGAEAPNGIVRALARFDAVSVDVIIMARGGGSIEDLWAFNEEIVARAMARCTTPIISGVGHEIDFTIADFVADQRAPTPSAAAELAVPDIRDLRERVTERLDELDILLVQRLNDSRERLAFQTRTLERLAPLQLLRDRRQRVDEYAARLERGLRGSLQLQQSRVHGVQGRLANLNPRATLGRGYALVTDATGQLVRRADEVAPDQIITVHLESGELRAVVREINP